MSKKNIFSSEKFICKIKELQEDIKISDEEFSLSINKTKYFLDRIKRGEFKPGIDTLILIKRKYHCSIDWLLGEDTVKLAEPQIIVRSTPDWSETLSASTRRDEYISVPILEEKIAAGNPRHISPEHKEFALIHQSQIKRSADPHRYRCIWIEEKSKSMEPIIPAGSMICIDSQLRDPKRLKGQIVVLRDDAGGCTVKRLEFAKNVIIGIPENTQDYHPLIIHLKEGEAAMDYIIGKVVWFWSRME